LLAMRCCGSSRSDALVQKNGSRVDEAKPCSAGGPDPACRAVDAASAAVPFGLRSRCACGTGRQIGRRSSWRLAGGSDVTGELTGMKKLGCGSRSFPWTPMSRTQSDGEKEPRRQRCDQTPRRGGAAAGQGNSTACAPPGKRLSYIRSSFLFPQKM
jgi:hypothetical protein